MEQSEFERWESGIRDLTTAQRCVLGFCLSTSSEMESRLGAAVARETLAEWLSDVEHLRIAPVEADQSIRADSVASGEFLRWLRDVGDLTRTQCCLASAALIARTEEVQNVSEVTGAEFMRWLEEVKRLSDGQRYQAVNDSIDRWLENVGRRKNRGDERKVRRDESSTRAPSSVRLSDAASFENLGSSRDSGDSLKRNPQSARPKDREMGEPELYRGPWPKVVSRTAKYRVKGGSESDQVTIEYDLGSGLRTVLAVGEGADDIIKRVGEVKMATSSPASTRGPFYINEYQHLVVPNNLGYCYFGGKVGDAQFVFEFEGRILTTKPLNEHGEFLSPGDEWIGPRPGIPYKLAAGGTDIYYESPALTEDHPPRVRTGVTRRVYLSRVLADRRAVDDTVRLILNQRSSLGGRFYVNEHCAISTPISREDGLNYIYCGQLDLAKWFPDPHRG